MTRPRAFSTLLFCVCVCVLGLNCSLEHAHAQTEREQTDRDRARADQSQTGVEDSAPDGAEMNDTVTLRDRVNALGINGSLRGGYWSSNRLLDDENDIATASAWLKLDKWIGPVGVFAEGYLANEDILDDQRNTSRMREAYVDAATDHWDFRIGRQIVAWGRADRLNPTDNLTPRDFTLLVPQVDEDRLGSRAARATWHATDTLSVIGVWLPDFEPNVLPLESTPGVTLVERNPSSARQWALKLDQSGSAIDWSVSWYDGFDLGPDLSPGESGGLIYLDHHRIRVLGFDAATTRGAYRFAIEAAYTRTMDPDGNDPFIKNPFYYGVIGIERAFSDDLSLIVQGWYRHTENYSNPERIADPAVRALAAQQAILSNQYDKDQTGMSLRLGKQWLNQTLETEIAASARLDRDAYSLRPKITYSYSDSVKLITGVDYFSGSDKTTIGRLERNRAFFIEARYFF